MKNKQAFTLIELLVVVLIIGILAAVALPQYQKAVDKSRMSQLITLAKSVMDAEEEYYLANGAYTNKWEELSLDFQGNVLYGHTRIMPNGIQMVLNLQTASGPDAVIITDTRLPGVTLYASFPHTTYSDWNKYWRCYPAADNARADKLCQLVTGKKNKNSGINYLFPGMPY